MSTYQEFQDFEEWIDFPNGLTDSSFFDESFTSSSYEPSVNYFPDLTAQSTIVPVDDTSPIPDVPSSALNIPWTTEATNTLNDTTSLNDIPRNESYMSISTFASDLTNSSSFTVVPTTTSPSMTLPTNSTTPKRPVDEVDKELQSEYDELAIKRAKNTKAARESRLRKLMKMNSLEQQVKDLKAENSDLQTRIAVLESQKKGLEEKNAEKEVRVKMLEQQLAEAHERLIKK